MSNGTTYPLWQLTIEPSTFPLAGKWLMAQIPSNVAFPSDGWWFIFASLGSPNDSQFTTVIGTTTYNFSVQTRDKDKASGTVTTDGQDDGTWSAEGFTKDGPDL